MSYILQALKKAEAERRLGSVPDAQTVLSAAVDADAAPRRTMSRVRWVGGVVGALVVAALAWVALRPSTAPTDAPTLAAAPAAAPGTAPAPGRSAATRPAETTPPPPALDSPRPVAAASAPPAATAPTVDLAPLPATATAAPTPPRPEAARAIAPPAARATSAPGGGEPWLDELPAAQRAAVPKLGVDGVIYAQLAADRMLLVNGQVQREGDVLAPQLVLERIERSYAVLRWRDLRFRLRY